MKYSLLTQLNAYNIPGNGTKYFYELIKDYIHKPGQLGIQHYETCVQLYGGYGEVGAKCNVFNPRSGGYEIEFRVYFPEMSINGKSDTITTMYITDNYFEIGARNKNQFYAKRVRRTGKTITYEALYYDEESNKYVEVTNDLFCINNFTIKGIEPTYQKRVDTKKPIREYDQYVLKEMKKVHDYKQIVSEVKSVLNMKKNNVFLDDLLGNGDSYQLKRRR